MESEKEKTKKILIVDDDEFFLQIQQSFLEREHFDIIEARTGEEALAQIRANEFEIVLMDLYMPEMDGLETMVRARAEGYIDLPIVIVSNEDKPDKIRECQDAGANAFLTKPIQIEELIKTVNTFTREAHRAQPRLRTSVKIRYRSLGDLLPAQSKDISSTGIFIRTKKALDIGSSIDIQLFHAGDGNGNGGPIRLNGEVVRALQGDTDDSGMGVKFVNLDEESVKLIERMIEEEREKYRVDIMVVDDDKVIREILTDGLAEAGYKVGVAKDGIEALKLLDRFSPSLILVDIMMPGMSGIEFSETLRKNARTENIPFVFISSMVDGDTVQKARHSGATFFIAKPFDISSVVERVGTILSS